MAEKTFTKKSFECIYKELDKPLDQGGRPDLVPDFDISVPSMAHLIKKLEDAIKSGTEWIREFLEIPNKIGEEQTKLINDLKDATSDLNEWFTSTFMDPFTGGGLSGEKLKLPIPEIPSVGPGVKFPKFIPEGVEFPRPDLIEDWATGVNYKSGDIVKSSASRFECVKNHTSNENNKPPDSEFWKENTDKISKGFPPTPDWWTIEGLGLARIVKAFITLPFKIFKMAIDKLKEAKVPSIDITTINSMLTDLMESAGVDLTGYGPEFPDINFPTWPEKIQCLSENIPSLLEF